MKTVTLLPLATLLLAGVAVAEKGSGGTIALELRGFRSDRGTMRVSLFASAKGYPGRHELALRAGTGPIKNRVATFRFDNVPHGVYAVSVLHDENDNRKMDTNWLGIPKEGGGASNNPRARMGPPRFEDAKFALRSPLLKMTIQIRYP
jgi:uncharacterized protein (DUF2141 family)